MKADIDINEKSGCDEKDDDISEEVTLAKKSHIKELLRHFTTLKA